MATTYTYKPKGVCSRLITIELNDDQTIESVAFEGGCNGNLKAIGRLVKGHQASEIADILEGNLCGRRPTSCADQLSRGLREAVEAPRS